MTDQERVQLLLLNIQYNQVNLWTIDQMLRKRSTHSRSVKRIMLNSYDALTTLIVSFSIALRTYIKLLERS